jgi:acetyltransferase-like isoleucine patch superfamily enzyme
VITEALDDAELRRVYPEVAFGLHVVVGREVEIGKGSQIASGACLYPGTRLGARVTVLENAVLGRPTLVPEASGTVKRVLPRDIAPLTVGAGSIIGASAVLYRGSQLGERTLICDLASIREACVIGDDVLLGRSVMIQVNTAIGARTKIMDTCHLPGDMLVESDVFLSTHVCGASENSLGREDLTGEWLGPTIRRRAYVGANATLLPGIELGEDSVVGAGSVVTRSVPPCTLVMGVPARFVRNVEPRAEAVAD